MLLLLMVPVVLLVASTRRCLQVHAPSNVLIARARAAPPRLRTAAGLALLGAALLVAMHLLAEAVATGAPGWLNLVVLILACDAIKTLLAGFLVVGRCVPWIARGRRCRRWSGCPRRSLAAPPPPEEPFLTP